MSIGPYCQRIVETGLTFEFPKGIFAEVNSISKPSRVEPLIAPGLITNGLTNIHLLCANLNKTVIKIQKNQIIGQMNLNGIESVFEIYSFGNLTKLDLSSDTDLLNLTFDTETLDKILENIQIRQLSYLRIMTTFLLKVTMTLGSMLVVHTRLTQVCNHL